jgi:hypothetical protein
VSDGENSVENSGPTRDADGKIRGGNPGNKGGKKGRSGRPPGVIRQACAKAFDKRIKYLMAVVDGETGDYLAHKDGQPVLDDQGRPVRCGAEVSDRLKAMDLLGKYGALQKIETETRDTTLEDLLREAAASDRQHAGTMGDTL